MCSKILDEICLLLETYKGRDKILRTLCYVTKLFGGLGNNELAKKFLVFSSQMSATRATLRLLDDLPMLQYNLKYGMGKEVLNLLNIPRQMNSMCQYRRRFVNDCRLLIYLKLSSVLVQSLICPEDVMATPAKLAYSVYLTRDPSGNQEPDRLMAQLGVLTNIIDQVYYPIEKLSWFAEHKLITGLDNNKWDTASSVCWVLSIYLSLMKTLRYVMVLQKLKRCISKDTSLTMNQLVKMQKFEILTAVKLAIDFVHAVNTLPPGFLWSCKLQTWHVGLVGSFSSILGLYQIYYKRYLK